MQALRILFDVRLKQFGHEQIIGGPDFQPTTEKQPEHSRQALEFTNGLFWVYGLAVRATWVQVNP
jgi:hypothetical protein